MTNRATPLLPAQPASASPARGRAARGPARRAAPGDGSVFDRTRLENGLRVVTEAVPGVRSVALAVLVDAGPRDERPEQGGLAHLTEHLVFQGTGSRDARQLAQLVDLAGGQVGGFTTRDYTCYHASVLDEHCTYAVDLLGDVLLNPTFPEAHLGREQDAIVCEIEAGRDNPGRRVHELLKASAWAGHPLGRPVAGRAETVRRLTREDLIYFFHRHYVPDRMVVAAAGHLDHLDFVAQVRDAFWRLLGEGEAKPVAAPASAPAVVLEHAQVAQAYFCLGLPAFAYAHPDRYGLHVLNSVLGGGISSRLFRVLREERGLVYDIGADYHAYRDAGLVVIEGSTQPDRLHQVLGLILVELGRLAHGAAPVSEEELWRAATQIRRQHLLAGEAMGTRVARLATQEFYFGRHLPPGEILAEIEAVDGGRLQALADGWLRGTLPQVTVAAVAPPAPHYDAASLDELVQEFRH